MIEHVVHTLINTNNCNDSLDFQMRSNPNLIDAPSPVIGYFKLDDDEEDRGTNGTGAAGNHAAAGMSAMPTAAALLLSLLAIVLN